MKIVLYSNGGSGNHGCEAIVRGTQVVLSGDYLIQSQSIEEDSYYGLDAQLFPEISGKKSKIRFLLAYLKFKLTKDYFDLDGIEYLPAIRKLRGKADIALSVGGDNYCYPGEEFYGYLNQAYHKNGFKTFLWGCSIEPEKVEKLRVQKDLKRYDAVITRESITYEAIRKVNPNTYLAPDPAFFMEPEECELPPEFKEKRVIGINASPMIISYEKNKGKAYENYKYLIKYILKNTDCSVALIPHVVWEASDDREVLRKLWEDLERSERIILIDDHNAPQLKYIISQCDCFVGARTHATIAAYSACVPTLVVGYSVKARGIAKDLFGAEENYVLPVQSLTNERQLTDGFIWLTDHKDEIRNRLISFLPEYKSRMEAAVKVIESSAVYQWSGSTVK